jgi:hypothetical protein
MPAVLTIIFGKTEVKELFIVCLDIIGGKEGVGLPKATAGQAWTGFQIENKLKIL